MPVCVYVWLLEKPDTLMRSLHQQAQTYSYWISRLFPTLYLMHWLCALGKKGLAWGFENYPLNQSCITDTVMNTQNQGNLDHWCFGMPQWWWLRANITVTCCRHRQAGIHRVNLIKALCFQGICGLHLKSLIGLNLSWLDCPYCSHLHKRLRF